MLLVFCVVWGFFKSQIHSKSFYLYKIMFGVWWRDVPLIFACGISLFPKPCWAFLMDCSPPGCVSRSQPVTATANRKNFLWHLTVRGRQKCITNPRCFQGKKNAHHGAVMDGNQADCRKNNQSASERITPIFQA